MIFFLFGEKKFRERGGYPGHIKASLRTYIEGLSPLFYFYILPTKRDSQQWDSNLNLDSVENDPYQLNQTNRRWLL